MDLFEVIIIVVKSPFFFRYKPYLIFFDISQCASLTSFTSGCPTPQVCIEKCPTEYEFPYGLNTDDEKEKMRPYCTDVS